VKEGKSLILDLVYCSDSVAEVISEKLKEWSSFYNSYSFFFFSLLSSSGSGAYLSFSDSSSSFIFFCESNQFSSLTEFKSEISLTNLSAFLSLWLLPCQISPMQELRSSSFYSIGKFTSFNQRATSYALVVPSASWSSDWVYGIGSRINRFPGQVIQLGQIALPPERRMNSSPGLRVRKKTSWTGSV